MRLFSAIKIPNKAKDSISSLQKEIKTPYFVKWIKKENLHITLKFFGETDKQVYIENSMKEIEKEFSPFNVSLKGVGAFPYPKKAKILWVGVEEGKDILSQLFSNIENKVSALGIENEDRNFSPHITFARVKKGKYSLPENIDFTFDSFPIHEVTLFKSTLTPKGPIYEVLSEIPLKGGNS